MKKFYVVKEELNDEELRTGCVSYARIVKRYLGDIILCNNINELDESIWENLEEPVNDEIYQYYLCDIDSWNKEWLEELGNPLILSYSNMLDLDVLMVDHFGTSWDYVITDVKWSENLEEC